jgi:hypothetical protein
MNKAIKIAVLIVLLVMAAVGGWLLYLMYGPQVAMEDIVPSGAAVYGRLANPVEHWHNGAQSQFWKDISAIDIPEVLVRNKVPQERIDQFLLWQKQSLAVSQNPMVQKFLGREIGFAMYPRHVGGHSDNPEDYGFLVIARPTASVQMIELLSRLSSSLNEQATMTNENYNGQRIVHVHFKKKGDSLKYTRIRDLFVVASEKEPALNRAIDTYRRSFPALTSDEHFVFAKTHGYAGADGLLYLNGDVFAKAIGVKTYALSFLPGAVTKYKMTLGYDEPKNIDPALRHLALCTPKNNSSLQFIPASAIGYQWGGCYDFQEMAQQAREQLVGMPELDEKTRKIKKVMEKRMGLKLSDSFLPLLGEEAGGYLTDVDTLGFFPYPRMLAFVKIKDRPQAEELLQKIVKNPFGMLKQEKYGDSQIHYFSLPLGGNMDPGYCFVGGYLLAASSRQLLKKSIDTYKEPIHSLGSEKTFTVLGLQDGQKTQSILFLKVGDVARRLRGLLDWGNKFLSSQVISHKQEAIERKKELADDLALKQDEEKIVLGKIKEWKSHPKQEQSPEEAAVITATIDNLQQQLSDVRDDINTNQAQLAQVEQMLKSYELQAENAKLFMFNSKHVLVPILKGFETINTQGLRVMVNGRAIETELMFN